MGTGRTAGEPYATAVSAFAWFAPDVDAAIQQSADPAAAEAALRRLGHSRPDLVDQLGGDHVGLRQRREALIAVIVASESLTRTLDAVPGALEVLDDLDRREARRDLTVDELVQWKQRELLRITARDLVGLDALAQTTALLSALAADVLEAATLLADAPSGELAVIGMGKLGGRELNYASDIDIVFVGDGPEGAAERRARTVLDIAGRCFRVDVTLRPEGRDGSLVRTLESYEAYWDRWAEPWEFQALLKASPVAGDGPLGTRFSDAAQRWLWTHPFAAEDLRALRSMKFRSEQEVANRGLTDRDIKRGLGGIRDIEFTIQLLQLVHGHLDAQLRSPNTLTVLGELARAGYIDPGDADELTAAYQLFRLVEHRLQIEHEHQVHVVPSDRAALDRLARVIGYRGHPEAGAAEQLGNDLLHHRLAVRSIHERVYFRPLLEAFVDAEPTLSPEAAAARLEAFGFTDIARTREAVRELTRGLNRSSRLMQQMLPLMFDWLSRSPNPDLGLLMLRNLVSGPERRAHLLDAFRESPLVAERVCTLVGTSRRVGDLLLHHPDLAAHLPDEDLLRVPSRDELVRSADAAISWRTEPEEQQAALRRWKDRRLVRVAAADLLGMADVSMVGTDLSTLADASLEAALAVLEPRVPFAVVALGRLGGAELSYASDLDLVFAFDGDDGDATAEGLRVASGLVRFVSGATPAAALYQVDAALRPEGKQGPLARSVNAFVRYFEEYALLWERQAMIRARTVAGDRALGAQLLARLAPSVWRAGLTDDELVELRRMKARIERERIPVGEDPQFHLKLGRGSLSDVEFTAQMLQMRHGIHATSTIAALEQLGAADLLDPADVEVLTTSYRFCERTRNRWFLVGTKPSDSLPTATDQLLWLARSLELSPQDLRERYRQVTRRARRVVERVFYGEG
jgi:glutamate-ammonia-ligase adenylyltransferase